MAHQHVITIPEPGVAGLLPGRHLVTAWDDGRTTIQWQAPHQGYGWTPPVEVAAQTETWTYFVEGADGLPKEAGA